MAFKNRTIDYRTALSEMRKATPSGDPIPFSLKWFESGENQGRFREEHNMVMCGQKLDMKGRYIDVRYAEGAHHDTRILITYLYEFNDQRIHL